MSHHELTLIDNAFDSLGEALLKFEQGDQGDETAYKFAVLHMAHFIELVFKYHISEIHPLLVYRDPFSKKLDKNRTIGLWDAVNFINNESGDSISAQLKSDLEWIKKLRNEIEHHRFSFDVAQTRLALGRLFRSVLEFIEFFTEVDVESRIPEETRTTFIGLSDEYEFARRNAIRDADIFERDHPSDPSDPEELPPRVDCSDCGNPTVIMNQESVTGYRCILCESEESDEVPSACDLCGMQSTIGELTYSITEADTLEGRCYYCSGQYHFDKND